MHAKVTRDKSSIQVGFSSISRQSLDSKSIKYTVNNAGLVLLAPFFPHLFAELELMKEGVFFDDKAREWAMLLLQFMATHKNRFSVDELLLNRILVGNRNQPALCTRIRVSDLEKKIINKMLKGFVLQGLQLRNIPIPGVQKSFLNRPGNLEYSNEAWHLTVSHRTYDTLLKRLGWNYTVIKHKWMDEPIYVNWG